MILPGKTVFARQILRGLASPKDQVQPCGIDLTLKRILRWTNAGVVDFDNIRRRNADTVEIPFEGSGTAGKLHLAPGAYLVEFNEIIDTPLDVMGTLFVRSSLFRSGALVSAGVMDSGYKGTIGGMLQVCNPYGLTLFRDAKLAQFVFEEMKEKVEGYSGVYQDKSST
ncbi:putative dUTP diphosphatase Dut [Mycena rebaudengoi]|nr:putative dUTP diphosphatase Dut [Mycena rebaudengoi]